MWKDQLTDKIQTKKIEKKRNVQRIKLQRQNTNIIKNTKREIYKKQNYKNKKQ